MLLLLAGCGKTLRWPVVFAEPTAASQTAGPPVSPSATSILAPTPVLPTLDRQQRAELFDQVWQIVQDHYLYPDFGGIDWLEIKAYYRPLALAATDAAAFYALLAAMVDELGDQHSRFEDPQLAWREQAISENSDTYVGVGVLSYPVEQGLLVMTVFPGSPAAEQGIQRRDIIVAIDGRAVDPAAPGLDGVEGSRVRVIVQRPDGKRREVVLERRAVQAQIVPEVALVPDTRIGYVLIQSFWAQDTAKQVTSKLERLLDEQGQLDGLIVDLRDNGGGWRTVLEELLAQFVQGDVGTFYNQHAAYSLTVKPGALYSRIERMPVVVLVDEYTESYAEVFAAVMQAEGRAQIVGMPSGGNTETIYAYDFDDGSRLWLAQEGFKLANGSELEGVGVEPDHMLEVDWTRFSEERDPHIRKAVELIQQHTVAN